LLNRRVISILVLLAVGVQTLPVRVCAVEQAVTGRSCHDREIAPTARAACFVPAAAQLDGHADSSGGHHDAACQCETPKDETDRNVAVAVPDLIPAFTAPLDLKLVVLDHVHLPAAEPPPDDVAVAVTLPLLN
jgi:hypothetical protein